MKKWFKVRHPSTSLAWAYFLAPNKKEVIHALNKMFSARYLLIGGWERNFEIEEVGETMPDDAVYCVKYEVDDDTPRQTN